MALAVLTSDSFNRANGALAGSTLNNAGGGSESDTWTDSAGTGTVNSNLGVCTANGPASDAQTTVQSTAAVAAQRTTLTGSSSGGNVGPIARYAGSTSWYMYYRGAGGSSTGILYKRTAGGFTSLGTGSSLATGDVIGCECDATTGISGRKNGVLDVGPVSDAAYATGRPGIYWGNGSVVDDFVYETDSGGGGPARRRIRLVN